MSTLVKGTRAPKAKPAAREEIPQIPLTEAALRHYTAEEIEELKLLPCSARWLKERAYSRQIPFTNFAGKLTWRLDQILRISQGSDVEPLSMPRSA